MIRHRFAPPPEGQSYDLTLVSDGSIWLLTPLTEMGRLWCLEKVQQDGPRWGGAYAVEARFIEDILNGAADAGLTVDWRN